MAKIISIGIDPGLSKTGLAAIDEQDRILHTELILITPTKKQKNLLKLENRGQLVNHKLTHIKNRLETTLSDLIKANRDAEIQITMESFGYYAPKKDARKMVNYIYETIAGITMAKCVLIGLNLQWQEIMPVQLKRIMTLFAEGTPRNQVTKEEVQSCVAVLLGNNNVDKELKQYAKNYREHVADALAISKAACHLDEYKRYMKLSSKKREQWVFNKC